MKLKLMALMIILSFIISSMLIVGMPQVATAKGEQQPPQEQEIIAPDLKEILSGMSPSDNISVLVYLRGDPNLDRQIQAIWEGQSDDEMHTLSENLMQQLRKVSQEMRPYEEQLRAGDPVAIERYKELMEKYGITEESTRAAVQRLTELNDAKTGQVYSLHVQAYSEMQRQVKQRIEQLPDTKVTASFIINNSLEVETKAGNVEALATIPEVISIDDISLGRPAISPYFGVALLSPADGSTGWSVNEISFLWTPFKETTKYKLVLAKDAAMTRLIKETQVSDMNYQFDSTLDYSSNYFWRVMALEPAPSDWSPTFSFQTEALPSSTETPIQSSSWSFIMILGLAIAVAGTVGFTIWFLVVRGNRAK